MLCTSVGRFRAVALAEGVSFLVLLLVAMPLKYAAGRPEAVLYVGWAHGLLFMLYAVAGFAALFARGWGLMAGVWGFVAAVLPGGTFVYDARFLRGEEQKERAGRRPASELREGR
ncbi:MAG: DUF3817 domain-containing protein [Gemmataceae bacterium]|nr:DUF3817 domain-containing protein [Gemmataceae bacterium]